MTPDEWRATGKWIPYNGQHIFVTQHGSGLPVLVLHAFPTASYDFWKIVELLKEQYCFTLFDYPGFGFSDKAQTYHYSLFDYVDAAQAVCQHFGLKQVFLLAHDIGDSVALELLRRGEPIVENLVLLNGSVWSIPFSDWRLLVPQRLSLNRFVGPLMSRLRLFNRKALRNFFGRIFAQPLTESEIDAFWALITYNDGAANYHRLLGYMPERWQHQQTWLDTLARQSAPLTLIWGMADPVATPAVADIVVEKRPNARYIRLEGVGHYPHWEVPETVSATLASAFEMAGSKTSST